MVDGENGKVEKTFQEVGPKTGDGYERAVSCQEYVGKVLGWVEGSEARLPTLDTRCLHLPKAFKQGNTEKQR